MFRENNTNLTIGEHLIYQNLPDDILARINKLINWDPFQQILASLYLSKDGTPAQRQPLLPSLPRSLRR